MASSFPSMESLWSIPDEVSLMSCSTAVIPHTIPAYSLAEKIYFVPNSMVWCEKHYVFLKKAQVIMPTAVRKDVLSSQSYSQDAGTKRIKKVS